MAGDLAAEGRVLLPHARLEERVADAIDERAAAEPLDRVGDRTAGPHVVEDRGARLLGEDRLGKQGGEEVAGHELSAVVDEEAAVRVAVPGDAELGLAVEDGVDDQLAVLLQQRVRLVPGELAVGREVEALALDGERVEQRPDHRAGHAVAAVEHQLHRPDRLGVDEAERVALELLVEIGALDRAGPGGTEAKSSSATTRCTSGIPTSPESGSAPSRTSLKPAHCLGLCEAVTDTPPSISREPTA